MLAELEWNSPHHKPAGKTLAEWVAEIEQWEAAGWLRDPETIVMNEEERRKRNTVGLVCLAMCWRERCQRVKRCRHYLPLALREFQPEYGIYLHELAGVTPGNTGAVDEEKLALVRERLAALRRDKPK